MLPIPGWRWQAVESVPLALGILRHAPEPLAVHLTLDDVRKLIVACNRNVRGAVVSWSKRPSWHVQPTEDEAAPTAPPSPECVHVQGLRNSHQTAVLSEVRRHTPVTRSRMLLWPGLTVCAPVCRSGTARSPCT